MTLWEYSKIDLNSPPKKLSDIDFLNDAGAEGWELIAITATNAAILKRPFPKAAKASSTATNRLK
jgi:hypothetical protein